MCKYLWPWLLIFTCSLTIAQTQPLILKIGESKLLPVPPRTPLKIGHSEILQARDEGPYLRLTAKKLGETYLAYADVKTPIWIVNKKYYDLLKDLQNKIDKAMGLHLQIQQQSCTLSGELLSLADWQDIAQIQSQHSQSCLFQAQVHPLIREKVYEYWQNFIKREHWQHLQIYHQPFFGLAVTNIPQKQIDLINKKLKSWGLLLQVHRTIKARPALIQVRLLLAEVSKSYSQNLGLQWSQDYQAKILPGKDLLGNWLVQLQALESQGEGRILAAPTLVAESGGRAEFLAGGEFPIRIQGFQRGQVQWKRHGLLLKIYPEIDASERIYLKIESEVSMLDSQSAVEGIPGLKVSRLNSQFNLENRQPVALSGLIQQREGQQANGISYLKNLPILGTLFQSRNFQLEKSELIIFVQPLIYNHHQSPPFPSAELLDEKYRTD